MNDRNPEYLKTIYATKEGYDGISIYFILADSTGAPTSADGQLHLTIRDDDTRRTLYTFDYNVSKSDFIETTLGIGAFAHESIILNIGRIPYSAMNNVPESEYAKGIVRVEFTTKDGRVLSGEESVYFN
jgi:hypothetical protein